VSLLSSVRTHTPFLLSRRAVTCGERVTNDIDNDKFPIVRSTGTGIGRVAVYQVSLRDVLESLQSLKSTSGTVFASGNLQMFILEARAAHPYS
jgi:hypothetical protein